ncbi:EVE domain-containing protein [Undibacterium sp. Di27W]|uniref:EVE domain-containing protein n=1 Tax=Undibacterium sp. Di27W TaxID=3413036 RepID=UPI003BF2643C
MAAQQSHNWIAVASADHVQRGQADGYMQVCHGKAAPLRRLQAGDRVVYYSPSQIFGSKIKLQAFTAIGLVKPRDAYQADMGDGFHPYRRDVVWTPARQACILPLLQTLEFSANVKNWGYQFRYGLFAISEHDMRCIAAAMGAEASLFDAGESFALPHPETNLQLSLDIN